MSLNDGGTTKPDATIPTSTVLKTDLNYSTAKNDLATIVEWLRGTDETGWEYQKAHAQQCLAVFLELVGYQNNAHAEGEYDPSSRPGRLPLTIPHVRAMLGAMRNQNRAAALEHGEIALYRLP